MSLPAIVLDTNVVLDWLLFDDPSFQTLAAAVVARQVDWIATAEMRDELAHVLHRGLATQRGTEPAAVLGAFDARARRVPCPQPLALAPGWLCSDPDDQKFVDLARSAGARWLLSRDRAVLKLSRRARQAGWQIGLPAAWRADPD